jgi:serine/threonine protein kinase/tetratricopeptide (TPR) repeat protein
MNLRGLTDSTASFANDAGRCRCGSVAWVGCGLCVSCLLQRGLHQEEPQSDSFDAALAEIDIRDSDWRLGNYQILEEIGRGGMGVIYRARQRYSGRIVALKRVLSYHRESPETLARFHREAEAAASLDHPNILPIYEVGLSEEDLPFFSMKFAAGGSLLHARSVFRNEPRLAVHLLAKVARGVEAAHCRGIVHRDLKPGNILLDGRGEPLVSDFGLAKWLDTTSDLTRTLTIFGTPGYIAPEQAESPPRKTGPAVDVYSLGAILFELLSGRPPFLGEHAIAVIRQATELPAPKLRSITPALDRDLETICAQCLKRDPAGRYRSAGDLANDLERWLEGRPIIARPVSMPVRFWRWSRRNPILASSLGLCVLLTIAILARQIQTRRLQDALWSNASASHSIAVLPFLDLDEIRPDTSLASRTAELLQSGMLSYGACRVAMVGATAHWTGAATHDEVQEASHENKSRAALSGTHRYVDGKLRISLHLIHENGTDVLGNWLVDVDGADPVSLLRKVSDLAGSIYKLFESRNGAFAAEDPVMSNDTARRFFVAGCDLIGRRTIADMDRAITCFEGAIDAAPRTTRGRSYLAMACMGRDALSSSPPLVERALQVAREAIALAPRDAEANRALCFIDEMEGRYAQSLEYGLRAIECGDQSERSFGQIAYAWKMLGHPEKAILWYRKAKMSGRQPADYDALLGDCFADLGLVKDAQRAYEAAMNFRPDLPEGWMGLCRLKLLNGDIEAARTLCGRQLNAYSGSPAARQMAALVEFFSRNYLQAERLYSTLLQEDPDGGGKAGFYGAVDYAAALARIKQAKGDIKSGDLLLQQSIERTQQHLAKAPHNGQLLYRLAAAEALAGNTKASLRDLQSSINSGWIDSKSLQLDPRFDPVSGTPEFQNIVSELTAHVAMLGRQSPAVFGVVK